MQLRVKNGLFSKDWTNETFEVSGSHNQLQAPVAVQIEVTTRINLHLAVAG